MKNTRRNIIRFVVIGIILALGPIAAIAQNTGSATAKKKELQQLYIRYLAEEGYKPEVDTDGDVRFKREGKVYFIGVSEDDPGFFRVVLPNFWLIESREERLRVLAAADYSNALSKVCKVFTIKESVWATVELFIAAPADFRGVFNRSMLGLDNGVVNFLQRMRTINPPDK